MPSLSFSRFWQPLLSPQPIHSHDSIHSTRSPRAVVRRPVIHSTDIQLAHSGCERDPLGRRYADWRQIVSALLCSQVAFRPFGDVCNSRASRVLFRMSQGAFS